MTPPQELVKDADAPPQLDTPRRAAIIAIPYYCEIQKLPCSYRRISKTLGIPKSTISDVAASRRCRRLQHSDELDPRGMPPKFTTSDADAVATYIKNAPFHEKSDSWQDLAEKAGVVKEYKHEKGAENIQWSSHYIQRRVTRLSGIKTHKAITKERHSPAQLDLRKAYVDRYLSEKPDARDWRNVLWCDELHWMTGPRYQKNIKREAGQAAKYHPDNIQYEKNHKPNPELQDHFHVYCVIGYDFAWALPYSTTSENGKMDSKTYTEYVLPELQKYLLRVGGEYILWQDRDSSHTSKKTLRWMELHGMDYILSPPKSPDLSVMETWVSPLKRQFWQQSCATRVQGQQRFRRIWRALEKLKVNKTIDNYPLRLQQVRDIYQYRASRF
ncbi:hypothetical protein yc1106_03122 [Curvularia clavata]|uniref:Uncharacterized protein n=1 Tax=Curvularia clavata TaxID=95742 RepID=A0A9Q9DQ35_CURCL|nr:hypothetical protein yc1106_03122 [Curvularia clavata]